MCILEYEGDNLKEHLGKSRDSVYENSAGSQLLKYCVDVAEGMQYLGTLKVHVVNELDSTI